MPGCIDSFIRRTFSTTGPRRPRCAEVLLQRATPAEPAALGHKTSRILIPSAVQSRPLGSKC